MTDWRFIKGYEWRYQVSNTGDVRNYKTGRVLKPGHALDYLVVCLSFQGKQNSYYIHRLVAEAFLVNPKNKREVNHRDGDKTNNEVTNLEWCTRAENSAHAAVNNLRPIGTKSPHSKFNKNDLIRISFLFKAGMSMRKIARIFKVDNKTIRNYLQGRSYLKEQVNES